MENMESKKDILILGCSIALYCIYFGQHDTLQQILHVDDIIILHHMCRFGITSISVSVLTGNIDGDQDKSMECNLLWAET